jgi:hypothetical protein
MSDRTIRALRVGYLVLLVVAAAWLVVSRWDQVVALLDSARPWYLVAALALSFGQLALNAAFWSTGLRAMGAPTPWPLVLEVSARSLLARWVPGSLWYAAGRAALLARRGVTVAAVTSVAGLEMALSLVVVFVMGTGLLAVGGRLPGATWWLAPALALVAAVLLRPLVNRVLGWIGRRRQVEPARLPLGGYAGLLAWTVVFWTWSSLTFLSYLGAFPDLDPGPLPVVAGAYMVAWGVGFLAPIAPQGLGVFEVTLAALLQVPDLAAGSLVVAGFRLVTLARDLIATGIAETTATRRR